VYTSAIFAKVNYYREITKFILWGRRYSKPRTYVLQTLWIALISSPNYVKICNILHFYLFYSANYLFYSPKAQYNTYYSGEHPTRKGSCYTQHA